MTSELRLTVGVTTRNRCESLERCLRSLGRLHALRPEILVFDDASEDEEAAPRALAECLGRGRVMRDPGHVGYIVGRNRLVREAGAPFVLLMDDDAALLEVAAIERALAVLEADPSVIAVGFAQAEADGRAWPARMQPSPLTSAATVRSFIGFAHIVRREAFLGLGGYREELVFYGEEKEFCLRALDCGWRVVYLPEALVSHVPDQRGRDPRRYVRRVILNDCLSALFNEPWPAAAVSVPVRLARFRRMASQLDSGDPDGIRWILGQLTASRRVIRRLRRPVGWRTLGLWWSIGQGRPYAPPGHP